MIEENIHDANALKSSRPTRASGDLARARAEARSKGVTWQAEKSLATRTQILDATLQCLVELGYTQTTTEKIAQKAGVSRGAMTHHFKSRADVFYAAAEYIIDLRAAEYQEAVRRIKLPPENTPTFDSMLETVTMLQKYYYDRPSFIALQELQWGARTERDLQTVMLPLEQDLDDKKNSAMLKRFPFWADYPDTGQMLRDLFFHSLKGVAVNSTPYMRGERLKRLHHLLARIAMMEMEKAYESTHDGQPLPKDESTAAPVKKKRMRKSNKASAD